VTVPPVTDTALVLVEQCVSLPVTVDGPVPPPCFVSGGVKVTTMFTVHETEPGAAPEKLGGRDVNAPAGDATATERPLPARWRLPVPSPPSPAAASRPLALRVL